MTNLSNYKELFYEDLDRLAKISPLWKLLHDDFLAEMKGEDEVQKTFEEACAISFRILQEESNVAIEGEDFTPIFVYAMLFAVQNPSEKMILTMESIRQAPSAAALCDDLEGKIRDAQILLDEEVFHPLHEIPEDVLKHPRWQAMVARDLDVNTYFISISEELLQEALKRECKNTEIANALYKRLMDSIEEIQSEQQDKIPDFLKTPQAEELKKKLMKIKIVDKYWQVPSSVKIKGEDIIIRYPEKAALAEYLMKRLKPERHGRLLETPWTKFTGLWGGNTQSLKNASSSGSQVKAPNKEAFEKVLEAIK